MDFTIVHSKEAFYQVLFFCLYDDRKEKVKARDLKIKPIDDDKIKFPLVFRRGDFYVTERLISSVFFADNVVRRMTL